MGEVALDFAFLVLSLGLALLGAVVGAWLQYRSWRQQHWEGLRERKSKVALSTVEGVSQLIDRRLYRQRRFLWSLRRGVPEEILIAQKDYQEAIFEWMDNLGRLKAELWLSFGRWAAVRFEEQIHNSFAKIGQSLEAKARSGIKGSFYTEERALNVLGRTAYEFTHMLLEKVASEELNGLIGRNTISFENWNNLTTSMLLRRLFGLPA